MAKKLQILRGTTAQNDAYTGSIGELTMDTEKVEVRIHDGITQGGKKIGSGGANLPILTHVFSDHIINDISWLRADTFSWQSGDVYVSAYEHLAGDLDTVQKLYCWIGEKMGDEYYTYSENPSVGETTTDGEAIKSIDRYGRPVVGADYLERYPEGDMLSTQTDTIGDITITYYLADDGHKICLPNQESNIVALYETTGVAWYYLLDTTNKQFKLPRTKWGFTGLRDSVGGYVEQDVLLPNITGTFGSTAEYRNPGYNTMTGAFYASSSANGRDSDGGSASRTAVLGFSASRSSSVYSGNGTNTLIQPRATQMYLYFYVGNFEREAVEQTAGITAETLSQKADIDGGNCSANFAKFGMPSDTYTDLTLGSSGSKYTAPADGWFAVNKVSSGTNQYAKLSVGDNKIVTEVRGPTNGTLCACYVPVKAGDVVTCSYTAAGTTNYFRFIYAEGAKHLA